MGVLSGDLVGVLFCQQFQLLHQTGIMSIDLSHWFCLVIEELSEKNNYPSKSEEYMANQVFYQIFFG